MPRDIQTSDRWARLILGYTTAAAKGQYEEVIRSMHDLTEETKEELINAIPKFPKGEVGRTFNAWQAYTQRDKFLGQEMPTYDGKKDEGTSIKILNQDQLKLLQDSDKIPVLDRKEIVLRLKHVLHNNHV